MGVYISGMEMPTTCGKCRIKNAIECNRWKLVRSVVLDRHRDCPLVPVPPHGDLIDRDALIKDGWLCLHKEVMRMGGYAIHELPLKNPSIPVIIEAEGEET